MATEQNFISCTEVHPKTGEPCSLDIAHVNHADARVKQHVTASGMKWPSLAALDPAEGWNDYVTFRL